MDPPPPPPPVASLQLMFFQLPGSLRGVGLLSQVAKGLKGQTCLSVTIVLIFPSNVTLLDLAIYPVTALVCHLGMVVSQCGF